MNFESFIDHYGYIAVFIGTFLEGETFAVLSGFISHQDYLALPYAILTVFCATMCTDQLFFYIGRRRGQQMLDKRPMLRAKSQRVFTMLQENELKTVLGFRFIYGLRTVTPLVIGASGFNPLRFLWLNIVGATLWTLSFCLLGYYVGASIETLFGKIHHYEKWVMLAIVMLVAIVLFFRHRHDRRRLRRQTDTET